MMNDEDALVEENLGTIGEQELVGSDVGVLGDDGLMEERLSVEEGDGAVIEVEVALEAIDLETVQSGDGEEGVEKKKGEEGVPEGKIEALEVQGNSEEFLEFVERIKPVLSQLVKQATGKKHSQIRHASRDALSAASAENPVQEEVLSRTLEALRTGCVSGKASGEVCVEYIKELIQKRQLGAKPEGSGILLDGGSSQEFEKLLQSVCQAFETRDESLHGKIVRTLLVAVQESAIGVHQSTLILVVRTVYHAYLNATTPTVREVSRQALEKIIETVFTKMEEDYYGDDNTAAISMTPPVLTNPLDEDAARGKGEEPKEELSGASMSFKDAYLLFKALCKLSSKELPRNSSADSIATKWKVLALALIKNVLEISGPRFRTNPKFIFALRHHLATSLLSNSMSDSVAVVTISLEIFELLVTRKAFRPILKKEIAAIFQTVAFRFLESPTAGYARRAAVLDVLATICSDPQTLTDLFLNYDCDMDSTHVFERVINSLCSAAQDGLSGQPLGPDEGVVGGRAGELRMSALNALVLAVKSMRAWCSPLENGSSSDNDCPDNGKSGNGKEGQEETGNDASSPAGIAYVDGRPDADTARFQETLRRKKILEEGIMRFNEKPKRGIEYLTSHGCIESTRESTAAFLRSAEGLDATMVGEYLGEGDEFNVQVMQTYTSSFNFTNSSFEGAMRTFLSAFRLPGEAQKIARIMENFASQFCEGNPDVFANTDTAYVLSYSVIMLNTDAHNPQVKKKMTKEEFIRNNRGINDGKDLPLEFLESTYDRIIKKEIKLSSSVRDKASGAINGSDGTDRLTRHSLQNMDPRQRAELFKQESERVLAQTKSQFQKRKKLGPEEVVYYTATNVHIVRLMLENIWCPVLAAVSVLLERAGPTDFKVVDACLDGFRNAIAVVSIFGMDMEKDAFVSSLAKFTLLNSIAEMQKKNVECIRMLLAIAGSEGGTLGSQWTWMIRAVVQLEQMRAVATGIPNKYHLGKRGPVNAEQPSSNRSNRDSFSNGNIVVDANAVLVAHAIKDSEVEQIYSSSPALSLTGVVDLCSALCKVSTEELSQPVPVCYCLQKLVDVVLYNVNTRNNKQWMTIWGVLSPYFSSALSNNSKDVCMYAIDSLKQLIWKFLEADEERHFEFQILMIKPFESFFLRASSPKVQETALNCLSQIALARPANIKSGWKPIFTVLALAADDKSEDTMNYGFQICDTIIRKYLGELDDIFVDAISGIAAYVRTPLSSAVALAAVSHLADRFAILLSEGRAYSEAKPVPTVTERGEELLFTENIDAHIQTWFPLLIGISSGITSTLGSVRSASTDALFHLLKVNGNKFSNGLWSLIYRGVLSPIFDDVRHLSESNSGSSTSWAMSTGTSAMRQLVSAVLMNDRTRHLLPEVLTLLTSWIVQSSEAVAREGVMVFTFLITAGGPTFSAEDWELLLNSFGSFFADTMPVEIMGPADSKDRSELAANGTEKSKRDTAKAMDYRMVRSKCVVQLLLTQAVQDTVVMNYGALSAKQILRLAGFLEESYTFAKEFNADSELRFALWRAGFMTQVPNLLKQETTGLQVYLRILFWLSVDTNKSSFDCEHALDLLLSCCRSFLSSYVDACEEQKTKTSRDDMRELAARTTNVVFIMENLLQLSNEVFRTVARSFFDLFTQLLRTSASREVRNAVCDILELRVGPALWSDGEREPYRPSLQLPGDLRSLVFSVPDAAEAQNIGSMLTDRADVTSVTLSADTKELTISGDIEVLEAQGCIAKLSPGSTLIIAGCAINRDVTTPARRSSQIVPASPNDAR